MSRCFFHQVLVLNHKERSAYNVLAEYVRANIVLSSLENRSGDATAFNRASLLSTKGLKRSSQVRCPCHGYQQTVSTGSLQGADAESASCPMPFCFSGI